MKILQIHNYYIQPGGEDTIVHNEAESLTNRGHSIARYSVQNTTAPVNWFRLLRQAAGFVWSLTEFIKVFQIISQQNPDVIHVHNTFFRLSRSVIWAAKLKRKPIIQTLHNYRFTCINGLLLREGIPCETCVGAINTAPILSKCYRGSTALSCLQLFGQIFHTVIGTYHSQVDAFIAPTSFVKSIAVRSGLPENKIFVKPHSSGLHKSLPLEYERRRNQFVFVGRVSSEKGIRVLLAAWHKAHLPQTSLIIIGEGPEKEALQQEYSNFRNIEWRGWQTREEVVSEIAISKSLILPSVTYETFGTVLVEAMSVGTPVIGPNFAGFPDIIQDGSSGFLYKPANAADLAEVLNNVSNLSSDEWKEMSRQALGNHNSRFSEQVTVEQLISIYESTVNNKQG